MRALLASLLVAGIAFWVWQRLDETVDPTSVGNTVAAAERQRAAAATASDELPDAVAAPAATPAQAATPAPAPAVPSSAIAGVLARLPAREPAAVQAAWAALAGGAGADAAALAKALQPAGDDVAAVLAAIGPDNACLHSAEGRALVAKAAAIFGARPDAEALAAGTQLLGVLVKGRIARDDAAARAAVDEVYKQHLVRVERWLFDPANVAGCRSYTVASGDSLARIAGRFRKEGMKIEDGTLAIVNRIRNPKGLAVGQKIKVPAAPIVAVLEKRSFALSVSLGEHLIRLYWVGHGANDHTPVTEFTVGPKQAHPDWTSPDGQVYGYGHPKNILGEYFIKFLHDSYVGFGAHGTPQPETIGTMSSMGCIRMYAPDIEELFKLLPVGSKVVVRATESLRP
jgi:nucleoid-associated protein YgaU